MVILLERLRNAYRPRFGWVTVRLMLLMFLAWIIGILSLAAMMTGISKDPGVLPVLIGISCIVASGVSFLMGRYWIRKKPLGQMPVDQYWLAGFWFIMILIWLREGSWWSIALGAFLDFTVAQALVLGVKGTLFGELVGRGPITPPSPQG